MEAYIYIYIYLSYFMENNLTNRFNLALVLSWSFSQFWSALLSFLLLFFFWIGKTEVYSPILDRLQWIWKIYTLYRWWMEISRLFQSCLAVQMCDCHLINIYKRLMHCVFFWIWIELARSCHRPYILILNNLVVCFLVVWWMEYSHINYRKGQSS